MDLNIYRIIFCGVGGQGILSMANIIAGSALEENLYVRQGEIHGMSQRGGEVNASVSISNQDVALGDIIGTTQANMILSMEPLESLRYQDRLSPKGVLISATEPIKHIPDYPDQQVIYDKINALPYSKLIDASALAKKAGSPRAANMVLLGVAAKFLPLCKKTLLKVIETRFAGKGEKAVTANRKAFSLGTHQ